MATSTFSGMTRRRSLMYNRKRSGERMDPWGNPWRSDWCCKCLYTYSFELVFPPAPPFGGKWGEYATSVGGFGNHCGDTRSEEKSPGDINRWSLRGISVLRLRWECPLWMRPCVRAFEHRNHILEEMCQNIKRPAGFIFRPMLTQKILLEFQENCLSYGATFGGNVGAKCAYITSNFRRNGSSD